jgi:hypothetical protein
MQMTRTFMSVRLELSKHLLGKKLLARNASVCLQASEKPGFENLILKYNGKNQSGAQRTYCISLLYFWEVVSV